MTSILDSLGLRQIYTRPRRPRRDGGRRSRKAVAEFQQPNWEPNALEPRILLSTVTWINAAGGDWDTPANWNTGSVPSASDDVSINVSPGTTITHSQNNADSVNTLNLSSADVLSISNGGLSIASTSTIDGTFNLTGGTLEGRAHLPITGALNWNSGAKMAGTGQTIAKGAVSINNGVLDTRSFTNDGTTTLSGTLSFDNNASFTNAVTATFNAQTGASLNVPDFSSSTFSNAGSVRRPGRRRAIP